MLCDFFCRKWKAFTLVDVMMAVTIVSVLVFLLGSFTTDVFHYRRYISQHQFLRSELFPLVSSTLPGVIREATAIDYSASTEHELSLFVDPYEQKTVQFFLREQEGVKSLILRRGEDEVLLHSDHLYIEDLFFDIPPDPTQADQRQLQDLRAFQPFVRFRIQARFSSDDRGESLFEGIYGTPRVLYEGAATLRNYSFSSLRQS